MHYYQKIIFRTRGLCSIIFWT